MNTNKISIYYNYEPPVLLVTEQFVPFFMKNELEMRFYMKLSVMKQHNAVIKHYKDGHSYAIGTYAKT